MEPSSAYAILQTTAPLVSLEAFHGILWTSFVVCLLAFALRLYIRYHCFRRLLVDDWIMMFALALILSVAALGQVFLEDVYKIVDVENGRVVPDASFLGVMGHGLNGFSAALMMSIIGILAVKINFLLFFKRLGSQIASYIIFWHIVLFINLACVPVNIALMACNCAFRSVEYTMANCTQRSDIKRSIDFQKASVILDVITDALIICFPIVILWNVRISLQKKIVLSCTFGLVALTIGVTIVRGTVFGGTYKKYSENETQNLNIGWMWFWIFIEFAVAFLIACIISFRALFVQREKNAYENQVQLQRMAWQEQQASSSSKRLKNSGVLGRARYFHDSLLQTFKTTETVHDMRLPELESGRFSDTFLTEIESAHITRERTNSPSNSVDRH